MSEHTKLGLLSLLLLAALGIATIAMVNTFQAMHNFQQQNNATRAGDVNAIRPWMTMHVISHVYHVPEDYLEHSLNIAHGDTIHQATLYEIAAHKHQPVDQLIHAVQKVILIYRKEHLASTPPFERLETNDLVSAMEEIHT